MGGKNLALAGVIIAALGVLLTWVTAQPQLCGWGLPDPICLSAPIKDPPLETTTGEELPTTIPPPPPAEPAPFALDRIADLNVRSAVNVARQAASEARVAVGEARDVAARARGLTPPRDGLGSRTSENGNVYTGEWRNGRPHGLGIEERGPSDTGDGRARGAGYAGRWEYGLPGPVGVFTMTDGTRVSARVDPQGAGAGEVIRPDGMRYEGDLVRLRPSGRGAEWRPDGILNRAGMWSDGRPVSQ